MFYKKNFWLSVLCFLFMLSVTAFSKEIIVKDCEINKLNGYDYSIVRHSSFGFYILNVSEKVLDSIPDLKYRVKKKAVKKQILPNDPSVNLNKIWAISDMSLSTLWDSNTNCQNVKVAVVDTGVDYNHGDLKSNIYKNPDEICDNGIDDDNNGYIDDCYGWNFAYNNNNPMDDDTSDDPYHGTHVTGILAAMGNNQTGIAGVCWKASIIPVKALDNTGSGDPIDVADAIDYAIKRGAQIINLSVEVQDYYNSLELAVKEAYEHNVLIVCAAGNASLNLDSDKSYFASFREKYPNVINVASYDENKNFSSFSNYGSVTVDVAAPGEHIYSTLKNNDYGYKSGTSMATPYVIGLVANIIGVEGIINFNQIRAKIIHSAIGDDFLGKTVSGGTVTSYKIFDNVTEPILFTTKIAPAKNEKITVKGYNLKNSVIYDSSGKPLKIYAANDDNITVYAPLSATYVSAKNTEGSSNKILIQPSDDFYLYLEKGWNLFSVPVDISGGVNVAFFDEPEVKSIWRWTGDKWSVWSPNSEIINTINQYNVPVLSKLYSGAGYWLDANVDFKETFTGNVYGTEKIVLSAKWNLAGTGEIVKTDSVYNLNSAIETVWKWNGNSWLVSSNNEDIKNLITAYGLESFEYLYPGEGFWIKIK